MPVTAIRISLALLFAFLLVYEVRSVADGFDLALHGAERVRDPFEIDGPNLTLSGVQPEARRAGIKDRDIILSAGGRPISGVTDFYSLLLRAKAGERLAIQIESPPRGTSAPRNVSLELRSWEPEGAALSDWLSFAVADVAMPILCLALGFWVVMVRIRDKRAWLLLTVLLSLAEFFAGSGYSVLFGKEDFLQPVFVGYHVLLANLAPAALLLFAAYFPERLEFDRRFPWAKWLIVTPLLIRVAIIAATFSLEMHHLKAARKLMTTMAFVFAGRFGLLHSVAVIVFFAILGFRTFTAPNRDSRRRLLLLDAAVVVAVIPTAAWLVLRNYMPMPQWTTLSAEALLFLFPLTMAYVIVVHRAMDVRLVIRQGLRYLFATNSIRAFQIVITALAILGAATMSADSHASFAQRVELIAAGFALIALTQIFAGRLRDWIDRRFFREAYKSEQILSDLASRVRTVVETGSVLEMVAHRISDSLHVPRIALLLKNGGSFEFAYGVGYSGAANVGFAENSLTVQRLEQNHQAAVRFDDSDSWLRGAGREERDSIGKLRPELLLPLSLNRKLLGIMSLGPKQSEEPYTTTDIQLLDSVATQTGLALENSRLTAEIAAEAGQRERMNRELEIAREVQERLFPQIIPRVAGIEIAGFCRPALGVGGDYYDYFVLRGGDLGIAVGDVSGKGFPAALLMASLRASLRAQTMRGEDDLAALMENVNTLAYEGSAVNKYATFFYGQFSPESRLLRYVNAGHEPPLIFRKGSTAEDPIRLETGGPVAGLLPGVRYEQGAIALESGDILVAFTDGISEAMNGADEEWGVENLIPCVKNCGTTIPREIIERAIAAADAFAAGAKQHDDMTIVVARIS